MDLLSRFTEVRVLVVGDVMLDRYVYGRVDRLSPEAPVHVLQVQKQVDAPGGAANVARNVAALGARVALIGIVGRDSTADSLREELAREPGIDAHLITEPARPTTLKCRYVCDRHPLLRVDRETTDGIGSTGILQLKRAFSRELAEADIVIVSDYGKGVVCDELLSHVFRRAGRHGVEVLVDPKGLNFARYAGAALLTPNRHELQRATGIDCGSDEGVEAAAHDLMSAGCADGFVVTRGAQGISVMERETPPLHIAACARDVVDVSGAGDTAVATLAVAVASGASRADAARAANAAGGLAVAKQGTAVVTRSELAQRYRPEASLPAKKVFTSAALLEQVQRWRLEGLSVALTNGCFDLVHPGHVSLLEQAKSTADRLIVALNSDSSVQALKGPARPVQSELARARILAALNVVDAVVIFSDETPLRLIIDVRPDVLVKGADYLGKHVVGADEVRESGGRLVFARFETGYSTTLLLNRLTDPSSRDRAL